MEKWNNVDWIGALIAGLVGMFGGAVRTVSEVERYKSLREAVTALSIGAGGAFATGIAIFWVCTATLRLPIEAALSASLISGLLGIGSWLVGTAAHDFAIKQIERRVRKK